MAKHLSIEKEWYLAARQELNPKSTQAESSHDPLYRDMTPRYVKLESDNENKVELPKL